MTIKGQRSSSASSLDCRRISGSALALKRYLDLTLRGTRKNIADHGHQAGKKGHPLSPYTFDQPDNEKAVMKTMPTPDLNEDGSRPPNWINEINTRVVKHSGEAPLFTENFLPSNKDEQSSVSHAVHSRPLSGISTKSAPVIINGVMFQSQSKKYRYLQACRRPASAMEDRMTRATKLRNEHRSQTMSGKPSDSTKEDLQRLKEVKPVKHNLNKDLLPIPCHNNETPHSFIIGARYNCSNFMDSRSFSRLGLYVPRKNPLGTFLKTYKGEEGSIESRSESDAFLEQTSVRTGGSLRLQRPFTYPLGEHNAGVIPGRFTKPPIPAPYVRKVFKETWLKNPSVSSNTTQASSRRISLVRLTDRSPVPPHPSPKPQDNPKTQDVVKRPVPKRGIVHSQRVKSTPAFACGDEFREALIAHNERMLDFAKQEVASLEKPMSALQRVAEAD